MIKLKIFTTVFLLLITLTINCKAMEKYPDEKQSKTCYVNLQHDFAYVSYYVKDDNLDIRLGKLILKKSKLFFQELTIVDDFKGVPISMGTKAEEYDAIIKSYKAKRKLENKTRKKLISLINSEVDFINKQGGLFPESHSLYLDIKTKKPYNILYKIKLVQICDKYFLKSLMEHFYRKHNILIVPAVG